MDVASIAQSLANGLVFGSILSLCAIGLTLVYGILNLSNFAHGDTLTFGAYMAFLFGTSVQWGANAPAWGLAVAAVIVAAALVDAFWTRRLRAAERAVLLGYAGLLGAWTGFVALSNVGGGTTDRLLVLAALLGIGATVVLCVLVEFALWRPLRRRGATVLSLVIASLGWSLVLRNGIQAVFGGDQVSLERPVTPSATYFGIRISDAQWVTFLLAAVVILGVHLLVTRTRSGKAMRALADNRDLARVCGIDVDRVILHVWVLSAALVSVAGVLLCLNQNNSLTTNMGFGLIIPIFASVLLGGVGSPYGAMAGGFVVGVAMRLAPSKYDLAVAFIVLASTLLIRPQGILGVKR